MIARGESILRAAEIARAEAIDFVARKTKASSGERIKHPARAVAYRVTKTMGQVGLLRNAAQSNNAKKRSLLEKYPAIREALHEIARSLHPSYKSNDATPVDQVLLQRMQHDEGGQVDYFLAALSKWAAAQIPPFTVSRSATWSLMQEVGIFNLAHKSQAAGLVLAKHYCHAQVKICRDLLNLFSAYSLILSKDAKASAEINFAFLSSATSFLWSDSRRASIIFVFLFLFFIFYFYFDFYF